ncbi:MAG: ribosomal RNA small subunit methyltransferase A [Verrucomicrobia bacterium]|nr:ribosomal RNA small subunit methyltransferase A [Verrucomicrobiota bacterium]
MKLTEMKQALEADRIQLTKSLGQNFLHDANQLHKIVRAAEIWPGGSVLEVGPGLGPLTELLLDQGAKVLAIEKDRRLYEFLRRRLAKRKTLTLLHADALDYLRENRSDWSNWKLVSNLPYSVASPILVELAHATGGPERMVATLQLEVAQRLMASAGDDAYGVLTLLVQLHYQPKELFRIPAGCFFPVPNVDSACVTLVRWPTRRLTDRQARVFEKIVKRSFSQRRKMMIKLLKEDWPVEELDRAFQATGLSSTIRAEKVTLEQFVILARALSNEGVSHDK